MRSFSPNPWHPEQLLRLVEQILLLVDGRGARIHHYWRRHLESVLGLFVQLSLMVHVVLELTLGSFVFVFAGIQLTVLTEAKESCITLAFLAPHRD